MLFNDRLLTSEFWYKLPSERNSMKILEPIQVGNITLKNRVMFPPLTTGYEEKDGSISAQCIAFYERLAKGGTGYIVLGDVAPIRTFTPTPKLYDDSQIERFKILADTVHLYGAKIGLQIFYPEYEVDALNALFATGDYQGVYKKFDYDKEHFVDEVSEEGLQTIIRKMCDCAVRAKKAGIDVIQIHGERLVGSLTSTILNHRTDQFGGSLENRTRFALELVKRIKQVVPDMTIDYKLAIITPERGKGGVNEEEALIFAKWLEEAGVDMLHVAQANHTGNMADTIPPMGVQSYAFFSTIAKKIKDLVSIPVSTVGRILNPKLGESILESGKADIISLGRSLLAEPDFGEWI
jgi:2,4-dienoyl-CoA reductase-like NADH-dependent reductase (Old Yellow Enzyme family)